MSNWKDASYQFKQETSVEKVEASSSSPNKVEAGSMLSVVIATTDGRNVEALSHQATRSVYPVFGDKK